jgi:small ligand-binding sensory domain FIST
MVDALSAQRGAQEAAEELVARLEASLAERTGKRVTQPDLVIFFASRHHAQSMKIIEQLIASRLAPSHIVGVTCDSVLGGAIELEGSAGLCAMAMVRPGLHVSTFSDDDLRPLLTIGQLTGDVPLDEMAAAKLMDITGIHAGHRLTLVFADPFSTPIDGILRQLSSLAAEVRGCGPILGGMASAVAKPATGASNVLVMNGTVRNGGFIGLSLAGPIDVSAVVSMGCKPVGPVHRVTEAQGQFIIKLDDQPAMTVLQDLLEAMSEPMRQRAAAGLVIGRLINAEKRVAGRGDYLVRGIVGVVREQEALAIDDRVEAGQMVQFQLRDAQTASEDLQMLMDAQGLYDRPEGIILMSGKARGTKLFDAPHHDVRTIQRGWRDMEAGEQKAKAGSAVGVGRLIPLTGFFASGEIGPIGPGSMLHAHSACAAFFRDGPR